jgi:hypothetical protein
MSESSDYSDLISRLNGRYETPITDGLGPAGGEEPDNAEMFVRTFPVPPIHKEAAAAIVSLRSALSAAIAAEREACARLAADFTHARHIAHDMREGRFPRSSPVEQAIAAAIRARSTLKDKTND